MTDPTRPGHHLTVPAGHLNDPLGVTWHDGRYELFVQLNPDGATWVPECRWGQVDAADLVRWRRPRTALEPAPGEGCWSGSVVVAGDGTPTIVYTAVDAAAPEIGRVALAPGTADWSRWRAEPAAVLPGPPADLDLIHFRDPAVTAEDGAGWRMVLGGGTRDGRAVALLYRSADLRRWRYDGVLAERSAAATDPLPTGAVWECPQLVPLDGRWLLLVSRWDDGPRSVVAAVGDFDGSRFTPRGWQPFDASGELYATTVFVDSAGRRCGLSWVPGTGPAGGPWAGMLSLPHVLALDGDRLRVLPHPDVDTLRTGVLADLRDVRAPWQLAAPEDPLLDLELTATVPPGERGELAVEGPDGDLLRLVLDGDAGVVRLRRPGADDAALPLDRRPGGTVRVLLDVGVAEVFAAGAVAVLRLPPVDGGPVRLSVTPGPGAVVDRLVVHRLQRWFPAGS